MVLRCSRVRLDGLMSPTHPPSRSSVPGKWPCPCGIRRGVGRLRLIGAISVLSGSGLPANPVLAASAAVLVIAVPLRRPRVPARRRRRVSSPRPPKQAAPANPPAPAQGGSIGPGGDGGSRLRGRVEASSGPTQHGYPGLLVRYYPPARSPSLLTSARTRKPASVVNRRARHTNRRRRPQACGTGRVDSGPADAHRLALRLYRK